MFENLCEIHQITSEAFTHNHAYPTCRTWGNNGKTLFVESSGPGPDGKVEEGVRHILAVDIASLESQHLATVGKAGSPGTPCYLFDYAPEAECMVYMDPSDNSLYLLNLRTMRRGRVFQETDGTACGPPSIASDGTRIAWWTMLPSKESRYFDDYITVIFTLDIDPKSLTAMGEPKIVEAYPRRKGKTWTKESRRDGIHVNHPQINPKDRDHICYSHEMLGAEPDGSVAMCRLWQSMVDESEKRPLVRQPAGLHFTHEVIAPDGKSLIFPYMHGVGQVFFGTFEKRSVYYNPDCCPGHLTVSPDQEWIAGDTWGDWDDEEGNRLQSIMMFNVESRKYAHLCWFRRSHGHPTHPHPNFSPDGTKIAFSFLDENDHCQVGYIDVSEVMGKWDQVAEGVGEMASPHWPGK
jgi:hypothetical protein